MGEHWLLKCCNATLSLALVSQQTKDSFGRGEDMEMHYGDTGKMYSLSLSFPPPCTAIKPRRHDCETAERTMRWVFKCPFKQPEKTSMWRDRNCPSRSWKGEMSRSINAALLQTAKKEVNKSFWTLDVPDGAAAGLILANHWPDLTV